MNRKWIFLLMIFLLAGSFCHATSEYEATKNLPNLYQGRFRSLDSTAQMWLYEFYHKRSTKENTALELLWTIYLRGPKEWNDKPLFWIHYAETKELLGLEPQQDRFSFNELSKAIHNASPVALENSEVSNLIIHLNVFTENEHINLHSSTAPTIQQLQKAGTTLQMLPAKHHPGTWISLRALEIEIYDAAKKNLVPIGNFTEFSDAEFETIRTAYKKLKDAAITENPDLTKTAETFANSYREAFHSLEGTTFRKASGKALTYPTEKILSLETFYYRTPLIDATIVLYALALFAFVIGSTRARGIGWCLLLCGLAIHTFTLGLRSYILGRPPVTNMFETVIYVPWIAVVLAAIVAWTQRSLAVLTAGCLSAIALLTLLKISDLDARMENVQAVLDSQFWLIIHVLMVVGSYGAFFLSGALGHIYLAKYAFGSGKKEELAPVARGILSTLYVGVGLLIPGTILGGVWAAESWGRFWDWDPKESWAFISACVYLIVIHSYTFRKVGDRGLAVGSVIGLISISFTWYGVNYILGTGLHSYGFGSGTTTYYFIYLLTEILFIATTLFIGHRRSQQGQT